MTAITQHKVVSALPGTLLPNAHYYVRVGEGFDHYLTNSSGAAIPLNTSLSISQVSAIAAGSTQGLKESLLANAGQVGLNVLAVGFTNTGEVQGVSLGGGNVVEVYASGDDYTNGTVLYREFMGLGEPIKFTGLSNGAIITSTQGFYGFSESYHGGNILASMPLMSLGLAVTNTFMYSFRESERTTRNHAFVFMVNGPLASEVSVAYGDGSSLSDQPNQTLAPWEFSTFHLDGNDEYQLQSTNPIMCCTAGGFYDGDFTSPETPSSTGIRDARLVLPLSSDLITHPNSGFYSALYNDTVVSWYDAQGVSGLLNDGVGISPGSPVDMDSATPTGTGNTAGDYRVQEFTRFKAVGLGSAYSGADGAGGDATPACPVAAMSQIVAQPLHLRDSGNANQSSVTIASPYVGTAKIYEWNDTTKALDLAYTVPLVRSGVTVLASEDQLHPAAGQVSNSSSGTGIVELVGSLDPGVIVADVPIMAIVQTNDSSIGATLRSQNGTTADTIRSRQDETLMFGITPDHLKAEITEGTDGLLYRREIGSGGVEMWSLV